jgi:hypothetical protein
MIIVEHRKFGLTPQPGGSNRQQVALYPEKDPNHALREWKSGTQPNIRRYLRIMGSGDRATLGLGLVLIDLTIEMELAGEGSSVPIDIMWRLVEFCCAESRGTRK